MEIEKHISAIFKAVTNWLRPDNEYLKMAVENTVRDGYFSFEDVKHAVRSIKHNLDEDTVRKWIKRNGLSDKKSAEGENVLCLHAGNLPLVGFQDAFATILSGATYYGKISRKDPYLLPTFLNEIKKTDHFSGIDVQWTHDLRDFEGLQTDSVVFAGSAESVPGVKDEMNRLNMATPDTEYLIRTADFSIAYLDNQKPQSMEDLVESIFRYGGKGCRSAAIVVSPFSLDSIKCELTDYIESFWLHNPQHAKPSPKLEYQFAYNKAVQRPQAWLDHFLIQEGGLEFDQDFICYWIQGDEEKTAEVAVQFRDQLQSIYVTDSGITIPGFEDRIESLSKAQDPPIDWKPDGVDTLKWLIDR